MSHLIKCRVRSIEAELLLWSVRKSSYINRASLRQRTVRLKFITPEMKGGAVESVVLTGVAGLFGCIVVSC